MRSANYAIDERDRKAGSLLASKKIIAYALPPTIAAL